MPLSKKAHTSVDTSIEPYQTTLGVTHLNYLEEHQPQRLERLFREGRLKTYLNEVVNRAERNMEILQSEGRREDEALELVNLHILCPPVQEDYAAKALSGKLMKQIRSNLRL